MVDRIEKALRKLSLKELRQIIEVVQKIRDNDVVGLDVKKTYRTQ